MEAENGLDMRYSDPDAYLKGLYDHAYSHMYGIDIDEHAMDQSLDSASRYTDDELKDIMDPVERTGSNHAQEPGGKFITSGGIPKKSRTSTSGGTRKGSAPGGAGSRVSRQSGVPGKENSTKSRARQRKAHEAAPFLCIGTLPAYTAEEVPSPTKNQLMRQKVGSAKSLTRAPPGTAAHPVPSVNRSRLGRSSSAVSSEWNALVPRQKIQPGALQNPVNNMVKNPFKQNVNKFDSTKAVRPLSPGQAMKERTAMATVHLARTMAKQKGEETTQLGGRLLKGRLKPLYPVKLDGPTMQHCRGLVSEENPFMTNPTKTVARRRQIVAGMLTKDFLFERPPTALSVHHTSVASDLSDDRVQELDQELEMQKVIESSPGMPPNSLASTFRNDKSMNMVHGLTSASGLSSDVFEIDQIPSDPTLQRAPVESHDIQGNTVMVAESKSRQGSARRPGTGKAVRFVTGNKNDNSVTAQEENPNEKSDEATIVDNDKDSKKEATNEESCKGSDWGFLTSEKGDDDDPGGPMGGSGGGGGAGTGTRRGIGSTAESGGKVDDKSPGTTQGQKGSQESNEPKDAGDKNVNGTPEGTVCVYDNNLTEAGERNQERNSVRNSRRTGKLSNDMLEVRASYNTVLYTTEDISFPRAGSIVRPKSTSKYDKKQKQLLKLLPPTPPKDLTGMEVVASGKDKPTKDYYDRFARQPSVIAKKRPRSAIVTVTRPFSASGKSKRERDAIPGTTGVLSKPQRPASAGIPILGKEVQLVIEPNTMELDLENGDKFKVQSEQQQQSLQINTSRSTAGSYINPLATTQKRVKPTGPEVEFKVEGAKMTQGIKSGICTECGKATNKVAEYWEETGSLVCDVCDRTTRAADNLKIERVLQHMSQVCLEAATPRDETEILAIKDKGDANQDEITSLTELERCLQAVRSEISQCVIDNQKEEPICTTEGVSEDEESGSDEEDEELMALSNVDLGRSGQGENERNSEEITSEMQVSEPIGVNGDISTILTEADTDLTSLSQYEMRVYWYQEYCKLKEKSETQETAQGVNNSRQEERLPGDVYEELKKAMGHTSKDGEINVYNVKLLCNETKNPNDDLLFERNESSEHVHHFKGERLSSVTSIAKDEREMGLDKLGVSGTAAKMSKSRPRSGKKKATEAVAPFAPLCFRINARPPDGFLYYFAYGPDMNPDRMESYIQRSVSKERLWGLLYGFSLVFNKKGLDVEAGAFSNIELQKGSSTEGCLYLITLEELDKLDRHLGYPEHYDHTMLPVWLLNCGNPDEYGVAQYCVPALVYVAKDEWIHKGDPLPNEYVVDQCLKGGNNILSPAYYEHLQGLRMVEVAC